MHTLCFWCIAAGGITISKPERCQKDACMHAWKRFIFLLTQNMGLSILVRHCDIPPCLLHVWLIWLSVLWANRQSRECLQKTAHTWVNWTSANLNCYLIFYNFLFSVSQASTSQFGWGFVCLLSLFSTFHKMHSLLIYLFNNITFTMKTIVFSVSQLL